MCEKVINKMQFRKSFLSKNNNCRNFKLSKKIEFQDIKLIYDFSCAICSMSVCNFHKSDI